jgi:hypothetical protein
VYASDAISPPAAIVAAALKAPASQNPVHSTSSNPAGAVRCGAILLQAPISTARTARECGSKEGTKKPSEYRAFQRSRSPEAAPRW